MRIENRLYTKKEILNSAINSKGKERIFVMFFKINYFSFGVEYQPRSFSSSNLAHFNFYAISRGFEKFTETGYRSVFVHNSKNIDSYLEIKEYFIKLLEDKVNLVNPKPIQLGLF